MYEMEKLNYNINDLEPYLDPNTIKYHRILEKRYFDNLNKLLIKNNYNYKYQLEYLVNNLEIFPLQDRDDILYNLGGALNHRAYFNNISQNKKNIPIGKLKEAIDKKYGSYKNFKDIFINTSMKLKGSGYTFLILDNNNDLNIINTSNQDTPYSYGYIPIIALDLWEHAYYLKYNVNKKEYIDNFFEIIDFEIINNIYESNLKA